MPKQTDVLSVPSNSVWEYLARLEPAEHAFHLCGVIWQPAAALRLLVMVGSFCCLGEPSARGAQLDADDVQLGSEEAKRVACLSVGISEATQSDVLESTAQSLREDQTPFLHDDFVRRKPLAVVFRDVELVLPSGQKNNYIRTITAFLANDNGHLLKIVTEWPAGESEIAPEREANAATEVLRLSNETYHGLANERPTISFMEALDVIQKEGGRVATAKQISAVWVVWSRLGSEPKPMWVITLRGIPPVRRHRNVHPDAVNHLRYVVDPAKKKWVYAATSPQPANPNRPNEK